MEALLHQRSVRLWVAQVKSSGFSSRPGWESAALRMGLELDEIVWFSERPADLQKLLPGGNILWFQRATNLKSSKQCPSLVDSGFS